MSYICLHTKLLQVMIDMFVEQVIPLLFREFPKRPWLQSIIVIRSLCLYLGNKRDQSGLFCGKIFVTRHDHIGSRSRIMREWSFTDNHFLGKRCDHPSDKCIRSCMLLWLKSIFKSHTTVCQHLCRIHLSPYWFHLRRQFLYSCDQLISYIFCKNIWKGHGRYAIM